MTLSLLALLSLASAGPVDDALAAASAQGIPTQSLEAKVREGQAKGVPEARIAMAIERLGSELAETNAILGGVDQPALLDAANAARLQGASKTSLRGLVASDAPELALWGLADLMGQGFSESQAVDLVEAGLASGNASRNLTGLATATSAMLASGATHSTASGRILSAMDVGIAPLSTVSETRGGPPEHANNDKPKTNGNSGNGNGNGNNGNGNNGNGNGNGN